MRTTFAIAALLICESSAVKIDDVWTDMKD